MSLSYLEVVALGRAWAELEAGLAVAQGPWLGTDTVALAWVAAAELPGAQQAFARVLQQVAAGRWRELSAASR